MNRAMLSAHFSDPEFRTLAASATLDAREGPAATGSSPQPGAGAAGLSPSSSSAAVGQTRPPSTVHTARMVEAMDEILHVRLARIEHGFDLASELSKTDYEARDAALHFMSRAGLSKSNAERIRNYAKAAAALMARIEVAIEREAQARAEADAQPRFPL